VRIVEVRDRLVPISRYADPSVSGGSLTTSIVAVVTDVKREGKPVVGFGFSSFGRFGQSGLIRERFVPRLLVAEEADLLTTSGDNFDPFRVWDCLMQDEKPGGHGDRGVAVGTLDMALWDAAAKIAGQPLFRFLADATDSRPSSSRVACYAAGGYTYPADDIDRLRDEVREFLDQGYARIKIKIGGNSLDTDLKRIDAVLSLLPGADHLAVDAMNRYAPKTAKEAGQALAPYGLWWFEDVCDPLDFVTQSEIARIYQPPLAAGEALFSVADARNLIRYSGLRADRDVLLFDPVHCYGLPEYLRIVQMVEAHGWSRTSCYPHGGHLFSLHVAAALGLGGTESNPHNFQPFGGFADDTVIENGCVRPPSAPGIGFETRAQLRGVLESVLEPA
jgi:L-alanine-DL-glutamate epimerase-like enolase superfamily enzyme